MMDNLNKKSNENENEEVKSDFNLLNFAKNMINNSQRKVEEKNLIVIGDKGSGKTTILNNLLINSIQKENYSSTSGINYNYIRFQQTHKKFLLNIYEIGGGLSNLDLIKTIIVNNNFKNTFFLLVLDFSKPSGILESLKNFLSRLQQILKEVLSQETLIEILELKKNKYPDRNNSDYKRINFFPADIIVIGNKYDNLEILDLEKIKWTCRVLRFYCHYFSLSLVYNKNSDQKLIKQLNSLISNQAFYNIYDIHINFTQKNDILPLFILFSSDDFQDIGDPKVINSGNNDLVTLWDDSFKTLFNSEFESKELSEEENILKDLKNKYFEPRIDEELNIFE